MLLRFISIFIFLCPFVGFGQKNASIDIISGFEHSDLKFNDSPYLGAPKVWGKKNWRFGLNYNRKLLNKLYLKTGLRLASVGYNIKYSSKIIYDFWYLDIPIMGRFEFNKKKITPFIESGVSPSIYLFTKEQTVKKMGTHVNYTSGDDHRNIKNIQLVASFSFGANFSVSKKIQLFLQPIFRYHITNLYSQDKEEHLFNYGVELGVRKKI